MHINITHSRGKNYMYLNNILEFNPLSPNINIHILPTILLIHVFLMFLVGRIRNQDILSLAIISFILTTCMFDQVVIL